MNGEPEEENLNKSEISQVFEIALKRNLPVNFEVILCLFVFTFVNLRNINAECILLSRFISSVNIVYLCISENFLFVF